MGSGGQTRLVFLGAMALLAVAALGLVLASPLALPALEDSGERDWQRLSEIGQTYGAVSALLAGIALGGVVVSLMLQWRSTQLAREHAQRSLHIDLLRMAIEDPNLQACFAPFGDGISELERRQWTYINQIVLLNEMRFEVGAINEDSVRVGARELLGSPISRRWWAWVRDTKATAASTSRRRRRFHEIFDEEWELAVKREPEQGDAPADSTSTRSPDEQVTDPTIEAGWSDPDTPAE